MASQTSQMTADDQLPSQDDPPSVYSRRHAITLAGIAALAVAGGAQLFAEPASAAPAGFNLPFTSPNPGITSPYGYRTHPLTGEWTLHAGTDYGMALGRSIKAVAAGTVTQNGFVGTAGNMITIAHAGGVSSVYMHMQNPSLLPVGSPVSAGEHVGSTGATGGVTAAHLHLEIRVNGSTVDPAVFLAGAPFAGATTPPASLPQEEEDDMHWYLRPDGTQTIAGAFSWVDYGIPERAQIVGTLLCDQTAPISISLHQWNILHEEYLIRVGQYKTAFPGSA